MYIYIYIYLCSGVRFEFGAYMVRLGLGGLGLRVSGLRFEFWACMVWFEFERPAMCQTD